MENPKPEKVALVAEVKQRLEESSAVMVTEYRGLSVAQLQELRGALRPVGGRYKVYKNTLVRRAAAEAGLDLENELVGPTALAFTENTPDGEPGDVVTVAKVLKDFSKANPNLVLKGGYFEGNPIDADGIRQLAEIEPREVLLAKLAGLMAAPMQQFASLLQAVPRNFAYGLQALIDEGGAPGAPASDDGGASGAPEAAAVDATDANDESSDTGMQNDEAEASTDGEEE